MVCDRNFILTKLIERKQTGKKLYDHTTKTLKLVEGYRVYNKHNHSSQPLKSHLVDSFILISHSFYSRTGLDVKKKIHAKFSRA